MLLRATIAAAALAGCGGEDLGPCTGDCAQPIELAPMAMREYEAIDIIDGDEIAIVPPLQGGYVVYVGARARNVHGTTLQVNAALREENGPRVVALEERPVRLIEGADGWARPESWSQDLANVAVCSVVEGMDFDRSTWRLEVRVQDRDGRSATTIVRVRPVCGADDAEGCACQCDVDPTGECDERDAGVD